MYKEPLIFDTDSYKFGHWAQYPPGTTKISSYLESRGGLFDHTVFFGLEPILTEYMAGVVVTQADIDEAEEFVNAHIGPGIFNRAGWEYILHAYEGKLPIKIRAVREGSVVPTHNVLMTIENTDPNCFWLTNFVETMLMRVWYPITVATLSYEMRKLIGRYLTETGGIEGLDFKLHDFGSRGVSSRESAAIGGAAHLVNFKGTDTVVGVRFLKRYYQESMAGFSIPAAEHSTITSWGRSSEGDAFANMLKQYPSGLVAIVSDSYNIYNVCDNIVGQDLKKEIMGRNGTVVIRPDSGDPRKVLLSILEILGNRFGYTTNVEGYKVLDSHVRIIQGDGVNYESCHEILEVLKQNGWSAANLAFGMGGALLQNLTRDTLKFAIKCSFAVINGNGVEVWKEPVDEPFKKSKKGELALIRSQYGYQTVPAPNLGDQLEVVFENGEVLRHQTLTEIRKLALEG